MSRPHSLTRLSIATIEKYGQSVGERIQNSGGETRLKLLRLLLRLSWSLRMWILPDLIDNIVKQGTGLYSTKPAIDNQSAASGGASSACFVWQIRVQDLSPSPLSLEENVIVTTTVWLKDSHELGRFKAFLRHLVCNWFDRIKVHKLYANNTTFLVTQPAPALISFHPDTSDIFDCSSSTTHAASNALRVLDVLKDLMLNYFYLDCVSQEPCEITSTKKNETTGRQFLHNDGSHWRSLLSDADPGLILRELFAYHETTLPALINREWCAYFNLISPRKVTVEKETGTDQEDCWSFDLNSPRKATAEKETETDQEDCSYLDLTLPRKTTVEKETETDQVYHELDVENKRLTETIRGLEYDNTRKEAEYVKRIRILEMKNQELGMEVNRTLEQLQTKEKELRETLLELGRTSVEVTRLMNEKKKKDVFDKTFKPVQHASSQTTQSTELAQAMSIRSPAEMPRISPNIQARNEDVRAVERPRMDTPEISVQESLEASRSQGGSLTNMPATAVERSLYNNYKLLMLTIADQLLYSDVTKFKTWARSKYAVDISGDVIDIFRVLDQKGIISVSDLSKLREFFEEIVRFDFVHLIDSFLLGNYGPIREANARRNARNEGRRTNGRASWTAALGTPRPRPAQTAHTPPQNHEAQESFTISRPSLPDAPLMSSSSRPTCGPETVQQTTSNLVRELVVTDSAAPQNTANSRKTSGTPLRPTDGANASDSRIQANSTKTSSTLTRPTNGATASDSRFQGEMGSNGKKLSKFQRPDSRRDDDDFDDTDDNQWLCNHYKRRCYVKFDCCNKYWPCHRCHNNESKCREKKLKSRDTKFIKCAMCGAEQQFSSTSQFCNNCHKKLAKYFCEICKHLTGTDDNPYHCEKCGICRIHGDRSFHCDVCGVCLDVQLRGNHKCRAGSAHDECCICLEDAFTGCQILPCSHKVHKECATQMIRSGITRCPICRESFAHKLEKRPTSPAKKPSGKR